MRKKEKDLGQKWWKEVGQNHVRCIPSVLPASKPIRLRAHTDGSHFKDPECCFQCSQTLQSRCVVLWSLIVPRNQKNREGLRHEPEMNYPWCLSDLWSSFYRSFTIVSKIDVLNSVFGQFKGTLGLGKHFTLFRIWKHLRLAPAALRESYEHSCLLEHIVVK